MITGVDLVEWQIRVASGQHIPISQSDIISSSRGCAVEARIYAENPENDFLPATGKIVHMKTPNELEEGIRADFGVRSGDTISTFYDPMIAKLIAYDKTRPLAVRKLVRALRGFEVGRYRSTAICDLCYTVNINFTLLSLHPCSDYHRCLA